MRYLMKQKIFSFGDDFAITDESGREAYYVDGRAFSLGDKLSFRDASGQEVAFIRQRLLSLGRTYEIEVRGRTAAVVHKHLFTFLSCRFSVDVPGPDDLEATGDFLDMEYTIRHTQSGRAAATISKRWFRLSDTYGVEVAEGEDPVLVLAATVVIDLCCHGDRKRH
jgi:uncharacterized protein YxjI